MAFDNRRRAGPNPCLPRRGEAEVFGRAVAARLHVDAIGADQQESAVKRRIRVGDIHGRRRVTAHDADRLIERYGIVYRVASDVGHRRWADQ